MTSQTRSEIVIKGARANNLKDVSLAIPHNKFVVVTGVSGSGKSSLAFEVIAKEGQRRYFETLPSFARQFLGKLNRPEVDEIEGLSPVIAIGQKTSGGHAKSTVGTISDIYDELRLLFARMGESEQGIELSRSLFSFSSEVGKCKHCNGIGKEEKIDLEKLVVHPDQSIREGALAPTLPNGYIMYSQVTIDVLNQVCEAEGFNVDITWNDLTDEQRKVILFGSEKIKVPFGKHSLESRLKWKGIKAKPREEGYYKGMIPIMSDILRRDRNANILKYVKSVTCQACDGTRLNPEALSVLVHGINIAEVSTYEINALRNWIQSNEWNEVSRKIVDQMVKKIGLLDDLGLGHLTLNRSASTLRSSEIQRIRVANQILVPLSDVLYVFDEPSIGLHREENERLIYHFKRLVDKGNSVIVVEHDLDTIRHADHIIEMGPTAGIDGGEVIFNGTYSDFQSNKELEGRSKTYDAIHLSEQGTKTSTHKTNDAIHLKGCHERNLKNIDVEFKLGALNVVSGRSGSGKSALVKETLLRALEHELADKSFDRLKLHEHENLDSIDKLIFIDHTPIGKTPRSNPATYLGISDHIRDVFAKLPESKELGFTKSRYSFNNKGGRCEECQGAGKIQIGMHFLGNVDLLCGTCNGDRFNDPTLAIKCNGLSIADCYKLSVDKALVFFEDQKKVIVGLQILQEIGLGYLTLGQSSTTLSGGEAQRIKIANQLQKKDTGNTMYVIIEPSIGLHKGDVDSLLGLFDTIKEGGNTIVCIEQDESIIRNSDWHIELGPKSGAEGGELVYQGIPKSVSDNDSKSTEKKVKSGFKDEILLNGVTTNGLKNIDVRIPKNQLTVVTGVSGSGKSSLVYDTLFAESNARFTESLSTYHRSKLQENSHAELVSFEGLGPAIGINRKGKAASKRSTVGTLSGVYDAFRLLYSRIAQHEGKQYTAQHFSFNHHLGACASCGGLGVERKCNPDEVIVAHDKSILEGAISENKSVHYYGDLNGQFMATLMEAARQKSWDLTLPWNELTEEVRNSVLYGTGDEVYDVTWEFSTKSRTGTQELRAPWLGLCNYIEDEYQRKLHNKSIKTLEEVLHDVTCSVCHGSRLKPELLEVKFQEKNIYEITILNIADCDSLLKLNNEYQDDHVKAISKAVLPTIIQSLKTIIDLGLGYLNLDRSVASLSGGERQRITLASQLSAHLFGVTYVLDEPTIGLDEKQIEVLTHTLNQIIENGNTVVVVEHDLSFIKTADYIVEMGPGAGREGGEVVYQGKLEDISDCSASITNVMLKTNDERIDKRSVEKGLPFGVVNARANNLKGIDVTFYAGQMIAVTGVSGSGKSSLVNEVLYRSWQKGRAIECDSMFGLDQFEEVLLINQDALAQSRTMTPASFSGVLDKIKAVFAKTEDAKLNGWKKADFSYLSKKGKCQTCNGHGKLKTSMDFMSDIWLTCDQCQGMRYYDEILMVLIGGKSIGEVLKLTVNEAMAFFEDDSVLKNLRVLEEVGMGHVVLGQSGETLSGGEAQRLKLATSMMSNAKEKRLYLLDEPSTGLHQKDIKRLIKVLAKLVDNGDTVLFIEHNKTLISSAHQVVRLGPGSGEEGGHLVG